MPKPPLEPSVLIIDDEADVREVTSTYLAQRGFSARAEASAEAGLAAAREGKFDLVLMDIVLPGNSGLTALRAIVESSGARVVLMTGHADSQLEDDARLLGAKAFLAKPIDLPSLARTLRDVAAA
jgi:CheY-like chemotaxis protein